MYKESTLVDYYAQRAREYEETYLKPERQEDLRYLKNRLEELREDRIVLELACGTGYWTEVMKHSAKSIIAIDFSTEVLQIARSKAMGQQVVFQLGDAYELPYATDSFDAGFAGF